MSGKEWLFSAQSCKGRAARTCSSDSFRESCVSRCGRPIATLPTPTASAPHPNIRVAADMSDTPPTPMMGSSVCARIAATQRSAMACSGAPDIPADSRPSNGSPASSIASTGIVLTAVTASAPDRSAARAVEPMSASSGLSFTENGRDVPERTAAQRSATWAGETPGGPASVLGQERFSSNASTQCAPCSTRSTISAISRALPARLSTTGTPNELSGRCHS